MAKIIDDLDFKSVLETYFGIQDIHKVLKAFNLPLSSRKPELILRILCLLDEKSYEKDFVKKVKNKINEIYNQILDIEEMAPNVGSFIRGGVKKRGRKKSVNKINNRYELDDDFVVDDSASSITDEWDTTPNGSTHSSDSFVVSDDNSNSNHKINSNNNQKKRTVIKPKSSSSESSSSESVSPEKNNKYKTRSVRNEGLKRNGGLKRKLIDKIKNKKKSKEYLSSSSSDEERSISDPKVINIKQRTRKRIPINVILSSSSSSEEEIVDKNSVTDNSDDDIEYLASVPANQSTINRFNFKSKNTDSSSSDTESLNSDANDSPVVVSPDRPKPQTPKPKTPEPQRLVPITPEPLSIEPLTPSPLSLEALTPSPLSLALPLTPEPQTPTPEPQTPTPEPQTPTPEPQIPEPQTPTTFISVIQVKSPTDKPHETTLWKNGQAIKVPPPPPLDAYIFIRAIAPTETINGIKKRLNSDSDEIETIDQTLKISLICPITNKRVVMPSRSYLCHHFDCFDINSFLGINYNKKIENWKCPKCKQPAQKDKLIIDSLLLHILSHQSVDPTIESVIFDNKAVWMPDIKSPEIFVNKNSDNNNVINILDTNADEIIELDDDDDEIAPSPTVSAPNISKQNKFSETMETAKNVVKNVSNLIHSNQKNAIKSATNNVNNNVNELLQFTNRVNNCPPISVTNTRTNTRWSGSTVNTNSAAQQIPINTQHITLRIGPQFTQQINIQQTNQQLDRQQTGQHTTAQHTTAQQSTGQQVILQNIRLNSGQQSNQQINRQQNSGQQINRQQSSGQVVGQNNRQNSGQQSNQQINRQQSSGHQSNQQINRQQSSGQVVGQNNRQNSGQQSNQQINRQQNSGQVVGQNNQQSVPQISVQQNRTQPQNTGQFISILPNNTNRIPNPPATTTPSTNTNSNNSEFKFTYNNNTVSVYCPFCNETFDKKLLEKHKRNTYHINKSKPNANRNTQNVNNSNNQSPTTNRPTAQTNRPPVRAHTNNNYRNPVPHYNNWRYQQQHQQQQYVNPTFTTQLIHPNITNNVFYPQPGQWTQLAPPAHQTPLPNNYTAPVYQGFPGAPNFQNYQNY